MGNFLGNALEKLGKRKKRFLLIGLDNAGKATLFYKMHHAISSDSNVESWEQCTLTPFDVGGHPKLRTLWKHYYPQTDAVIFMVDASDVDRIETARQQFHITLCDMGKWINKCAVLVLANKMDLVQAANEDVNARLEYITRKMGMQREVEMDVSFIKQIQSDTLLKYLPHDLLQIVLDYGVDIETGPVVQLQPEHLIDREVNALQDDESIMQIICDYLPKYTYCNLDTKLYRVMGCSAVDAEGFREPLEWLMQ